MTGRAHTGARAAEAEAATARWKLMAVWSAVAVAAVLLVLKAGAWAATGSLALLGSLIDSALDLMASGINLIAVRHALEPADAEHRFGHGKAEAIAGLAQAAAITGSAVFLALESLGRLIAPQPVDNSLVGIAVMLVAIVLTAGLVILQRHVVARSGSVAIAADHLHYAGDLLMNLTVIVALAAASWFDMSRVDAAAGLLVAAMIGWGAVQIFRLSYDQLMDRELEEIERARIKDIVLRHPEVRAVHDLRTRRAGAQTFIQFHIELDPQLRLVAAHAISDAVEDAVLALYPQAEVIIHQDPAGLPDRNAAIARLR